MACINFQKVEPVLQGSLFSQHLLVSQKFMQFTQYAFFLGRDVFHLLSVDLGGFNLQWWGSFEGRHFEGCPMLFQAIGHEKLRTVFLWHFSTGSLLEFVLHALRALRPCDPIFLMFFSSIFSSSSEFVFRSFWHQRIYDTSLGSQDIAMGREAERNWVF